MGRGPRPSVIVCYSNFIRSVEWLSSENKKKKKTIYHLNFYSGLQPLGWGPVLGLGPFGTGPQKEEVNGTLIQCDVTDTVRI